MKIVLDLVSAPETKFFSIFPESLAIEAAKLMAAENLGAVVVLKDGRLKGIVSERDVTRKITLQNKSPKKTFVRDVMTTEVVVAHPEMTVEDCLRIMNQVGIRHLPVLRRDEVIGCVSILDVSHALLNEQSALIKNLEKHVSQTWPL